MTWDAIVVGGGIVGLCTAWQLRRRGVKRIAVVERFRMGHGRGSSHGKSRITRSTYHDALYVQLMQQVHTELWPALEADLGQQVLHPNPGIFFGPEDGLFARHAEAVAAAGADVERISRAEARRRFPQFTFVDAPEVLQDNTGGVLAAERILQGLRDWLEAQGVALLEGRPVRGVEPTGDAIRLDTAGGVLEAEKVAICAGPWLARLVPRLAHRITPARQNVGYFRLGGPPEQMELGAFPVWAYLGREPHQLYYGLPAFEGTGVKAARHYVATRADDPEQLRGPDPVEIRAVRSWLAPQLTVPIRAVERTETCWYTNTATKDLVLDRLGDHPNLVVGGGMSGHGFKLAPLSGRILAELLLDGSTSVDAYERHRGRFACEPGPP